MNLFLSIQLVLNNERLNAKYLIIKIYFERFCFFTRMVDPTGFKKSRNKMTTGKDTYSRSVVTTFVQFCLFGKEAHC
jgi:hypothetical protein